MWLHSKNALQNVKSRLARVPRAVELDHRYVPFPGETFVDQLQVLAMELSDGSYLHISVPRHQHLQSNYFAGPLTEIDAEAFVAGAVAVAIGAATGPPL